MKKAIVVKLGAVDFTIEEDAYSLLKNYLDDIESRLMPYESRDVLNDIEFRVADILSENMSNSVQVVNVSMVRRVIDVIGDPSNFGGRRHSNAKEHVHEPRRLYRSTTNEIIGGVCGGLAEFLHVDPTVIRLLTVLLVMFGGLSLWVYIILWILTPKAPASVSK